MDLNENTKYMQRENDIDGPVSPEDLDKFRSLMPSDGGLGQKLIDPFELVNLSRKGINYKLFQKIVNSSPFSMKEWSRFLHITERTIQRYKKDQRKFETLQTERIIDIAKLQMKGREVFGDTKYFEEWMNSKIIALGNIRPIELLDTSFGIDMLMDELGRIEHGILA